MIPCCIRLYRVKNKSYKPEITKIKRKPPANIYRVAFSNKAIEMIFHLFLIAPTLNPVW